MRNRIILTCTLIIALTASAGFAQEAKPQREKEELQMIALEALMASPSERSLPALIKLLDGDGSDELKENALFVLSQIEHPDASAKLLSYAHDGTGEIQLEAIRMIAINGDKDTMAGLADIYANGDSDVREAVLEAYMIADDVQSVFNIAMQAQDDDDYEMAVEMLGMMDAHAELVRLREEKGISDALIEAYMISDNDAELRILAADTSNTDLQAEAIEALGIVGARGTDVFLADIFRNTDNEDIREAVVESLFIGDYDDVVLELYRTSDDIGEKRVLLEALVSMDSEHAMEVIDQALAGDQ